MSQLPHLAARILGVPLMIDPPKFRAMLAVIGPRIGIPGPAMPELLSQVDQRFSIVSGPRMDAEYRTAKGAGWGYRFEHGIACIDISGALTNRMNFNMDASVELRSYESIRADLTQAAKSPDVKGILLRMDTPGGEVAGAFDMADFIAVVNKEKPIWAVTDDAAFSAGYLLASQAKRVLVSQTGGLGSIGVIFMHVDLSGLLAGEGIKVTTIFAGEHKNDLSPYEPLSDGAKGVVTDLVMKDYRMFVNAVARGRKGMKPEDVAATEAGLFFGADALTAKLADAVVNFQTALSDMQRSIGVGQQTFGFAGAETLERSAETDKPAEEPEKELEPEASGVKQKEGTAMAEQVVKPEATNSPPVDVEAVRSEAKKAGHADAAEIVELCTLAGKIELAQGFLTENKSVKEVRAALLGAKADDADKSPKVSGKTLATSGLKDHPRQVDSMRAYLKRQGIRPADERGAN